MIKQNIEKTRRTKAAALLALTLGPGLAGTVREAGAALTEKIVFVSDRKSGAGVFNSTWTARSTA